MSQQENATQNAIADQTVDSAPTQVDTPPADQTVDSAPTEVSQDEPQVQQEAPEQSKAVKELIAQRKKRQQAEQEAAYWRGVAEGKIKEQTPSEPKPRDVEATSGAPVEPNSSDFDDFEEFERAKDEYIINMTAYRISQRQAQKAQEAKEKELVDNFQRQMKEAAKLDPSIYEIASDRTLPVSQAMVPLIQASDIAPEIIRWIDSNRDEAIKIAQLPPIYAARELALVEAKLKFKPVTQDPPKKVSQAPEPIKTVTPAGATVIDEADLPMDQFFARRNKAQFGR